MPSSRLPTNTTPSNASSSASPRFSKGLQIALGAAAIALLLGWYGVRQLEDDGLSFQYFQSLEEFHANAATLVGRAARVHGYVAIESIERNLEAQSVRFAVQNAPPHAGAPTGETLTVVYESLETPDLFQDGAEVVVEGHLVARDGGAVFEADKILAKCPSKFEPKSDQSAES